MTGLDCGTHFGTPTDLLFVKSDDSREKKTKDVRPQSTRNAITNENTNFYMSIDRSVAYPVTKSDKKAIWGDQMMTTRHLSSSFVLAFRWR
jgi:hypothetical protein